MIRYIIFLLVLPTLSFSQTKKVIHGKVIGMSKDTLMIYPDRSIPKKFYEIEEMIMPIDDETFTLSSKITYPQLVYTIFAKDQGYVLNRPKSFFVDETSTAIVINASNWEDSYIQGKTGNEYEEQFKPFINGQKTKADNYSLYSLPFLKDAKVDTLLFNYSKSNPDSFISLWFLIKRYYQFGHSEVREKHLQQFSDNVKKNKIWQLLNEDISNTLLKEGKLFPPMQLLNSNLQSHSLTDNTGKYFLLDFWFTSCKPCLEAIPRLNDIYKKFNKSGLEIISVSVDRDPTVKKWLRRIMEGDMPWKHSLDLNGLNSEKLFVKNFPRYILLDENWKVISTDITLDRLETFLNDKLK